MQAIRGIQAFDACWDALKQTYPMSQTENTLLVQSMGRFVDAYGTQSEIRANLPQSLQILFDRLVDAYINGYVPSQVKPPQPAAVSQPVALPQPAALSQSAAMPQTATATAAAPPRLTATTLAMAELRRQLPEPALANEAATFVLDAPSSDSPTPAVECAEVSISG